MRRTILLLSVVALALASCGADTDEGQDAEPTGAAQPPVTFTATGGSPGPPRQIGAPTVAAEIHASCAAGARLDGRRYFGSAVRQVPEYGDPLGRAEVPPCQGGGGHRIEAVAIVGIDPRVAWASPGDEETVYIADDVTELPPELQSLRREPTCADEDAPVELRGPWLGIIEPDGDTEVDLVPPYDLEMRVVEASAPTYEDAYLTIHVAVDAGTPLTREDVRTSLWEGGDLSVSATCIDGEFWAERVAASAPS